MDLKTAIEVLESNKEYIKGVDIFDGIRVKEAIDVVIKEVKKEPIEKCHKCEKGKAQEDHTCPYQSDVNNDDTFTCTCCEDCTHDCAMDI